MSSGKPPRLRRADFGDGEAYAEALWYAGGPEFGQEDEIRHLPGPYGVLLREVYGPHPDDARAEDQAQEQRPQVFVKKFSPPRRKTKKR